MDVTSQMKSYLSGDVILYYIIGFILLENVFELYLTMRQVSIYELCTPNELHIERSRHILGFNCTFLLITMLPA